RHESSCPQCMYLVLLPCSSASLCSPSADTHRDLISFPTRRSSDLRVNPAQRVYDSGKHSRRSKISNVSAPNARRSTGIQRGERRDRKSTRLNSSHLGISYAVFCLKKKMTQTMARDTT